MGFASGVSAVGNAMGGGMAGGRAGNQRGGDWGGINREFGTLPQLNLGSIFRDYFMGGPIPGTVNALSKIYGYMNDMPSWVNTGSFTDPVNVYLNSGGALAAMGAGRAGGSGKIPIEGNPTFGQQPAQASPVGGNALSGIMRQNPFAGFYGNMNSMYGG